MAPKIPSLDEYNPTEAPQALLLKDAPLLLEYEYLPLEAGYAITPDGMHHVAASTYMRGCSGKMIDWWFGWVHHTHQYKLWHPRDHIFSDWRGPRDNTSSYIGGHHRVHETIDGHLEKLNISFVDPGIFFGADWRGKFNDAGYSTAICGRVGLWNDEDDTVIYQGHLIHLIKEEPDGCRMRSRFWIGDIEGITNPQQRVALIPEHMCSGLVKHATEEMAILATRLPSLYADFANKDDGTYK